jgi:6-phosphogluconate dehydrogenase
LASKLRKAREMVLLVKASTAVDLEKSHHRRQSIKKGAHSIQEWASKLRKARKMVLLVKAGPAVDDFIKQLDAFLEKGDHRWR